MLDRNDVIQKVKEICLPPKALLEGLLYLHKTNLVKPSLRQQVKELLSLIDKFAETSTDIYVQQYDESVEKLLRSLKIRYMQNDIVIQKPKADTTKDDNINDADDQIVGTLALIDKIESLKTRSDKATDTEHEFSIDNFLEQFGYNPIGLDETDKIQLFQDFVIKLLTEYVDLLTIVLEFDGTFEQLKKLSDKLTSDEVPFFGVAREIKTVANHLSQTILSELQRSADTEDKTALHKTDIPKDVTLSKDDLVNILQQKAKLELEPVNEKEASLIENALSSRLKPCFNVIKSSQDLDPEKSDTGIPLINIPSFITAWDVLTLGFETSRLYMILSFFGSGKSTVLQNLALGIALGGSVYLRELDKWFQFGDTYTPVVVFLSFENLKEELQEREIMIVSDLEKEQLRELGPTDIIRHINTKVPGGKLISLFGLPILYRQEYEHEWSIYDIKAWLDELKLNKYYPVALFVDSVDLIKPTLGTRKRERWEILGELALGLKKIAKQYHIPVFTCAQLGRGIERGEGTIESNAFMSESIEHGKRADTIINIELFDGRTKPGSQRKKTYVSKLYEVRPVLRYAITKNRGAKVRTRVRELLPSVNFSFAELLYGQYNYFVSLYATLGGTKYCVFVNELLDTFRDSASLLALEQIGQYLGVMQNGAIVDPPESIVKVLHNSRTFTNATPLYNVCFRESVTFLQRIKEQLEQLDNPNLTDDLDLSLLEDAVNTANMSLSDNSIIEQAINYIIPQTDDPLAVPEKTKFMDLYRSILWKDFVISQLYYNLLYVYLLQQKQQIQDYRQIANDVDNTEQLLSDEKVIEQNDNTQDENEQDITDFIL